MLDRISLGQTLVESRPSRKTSSHKGRRQLNNTRERQHNLGVLTARFRNALKKSVEGIIEAGRVLMEAKNRARAWPIYRLGCG